MGKDLEGTSRDKFEILSGNFHEGAEEYHGKPERGYQVSHHEILTENFSSTIHRYR
jgi:hypothetical protein